MGLAGPVLAEAPQTSAGCENNPTHAFTIPAWAFDRGNAQTFTKDYADAGPMIAFGGESPVIVEYDMEFPSATDYRLRVQYAAAEQRPVALSVDGREVTKICRSVTGSWNTSGAGWEEGATLSLTAGKHTLKLERAGSFPHLMNLRFDSALPLPAGWAVNRPKARKLSDRPPPAVVLHEPQVNLPALRRAIEDLERTFGETYPNGSRFLAPTGRTGVRRRRPAGHPRCNSSPCNAKPCSPIRCWISPKCCWSNVRPTRHRSGCRATGKATAPCPRAATMTNFACGR